MTQTIDPLVPLSPDFLQRVAMGEASGLTAVHRVGAALDVGTTATPVTSGLAYPMPTAAVSLEVVSSSADDASGGSGARTVRVTTLDADFAVQTETVTLNGITSVPLTLDAIRVLDFEVLTSGTYGTPSTPSHNSTITLRVESGGATWATIVPQSSIGMAKSLIGCYTIPAGKRGFLASRSLIVQSTNTVNMQLFIREGADTVAAPFTPFVIHELDRGTPSEGLTTYPVLLGPYTGPCDIGILAAAVASTASVSVNFDLLLEDV